MNGYGAVYKKIIDNKNAISPNQITRGNFYLIKEYTYADGTKENYSETTAPLVFVLFVGKAKDIIHTIKVSNITPATIKKLFGKMFDEETEDIKLKGNSRDIYSKVVSKSPNISDKAYRTYNISGIGKVFKLDMDVEKLVPKSSLNRAKENKK